MVFLHPGGHVTEYGPSLTLTAAVHIRDLRFGSRSLHKLLCKKRQDNDVGATGSSGGTFISALRMWTREKSAGGWQSPPERTPDLRRFLGGGQQLERQRVKTEGSGEGCWQGDYWGTGSCFW